MGETQIAQLQNRWLGLNEKGRCFRENVGNDKADGPGYQNEWPFGREQKENYGAPLRNSPECGNVRSSIFAAVTQTRRPWPETSPSETESGKD